MSLKKVELPQCLPLLIKLLEPDRLKAVLLAIRSGESSNLPKEFETSRRILTARQKKVVDGHAHVVGQTPKVCSLEQTNKLVQNAALQLSSLELRNQKDSSTCTLIIGRNKEVSLFKNIIF